MLSNKIIYFIGATFLFLGFFWMFLPHVYHVKILEEENFHIVHVFQGFAVAILGLALMLYSTKEQNHPIIKFLNLAKFSKKRKR